MEINISLSVLLSVGGIIASVAATFAIMKTKVARIEEMLNMYEKRIEEIRETSSRYQADETVRIALLERNQEAHAKELAELKGDIKVIMTNVQEIKEVVITVKKGDK